MEGSKITLFMCLKGLRASRTFLSFAMRRCGRSGLGAVILPPQPLRQLGYIGSDAPGLVPREQMRRRAPARLLLEIDIRERLPGMILHDEAGIGLLDGPGRREAAGRHEVDFIS